MQLGLDLAPDLDYVLCLKDYVCSHLAESKFHLSDIFAFLCVCIHNTFRGTGHKGFMSGSALFTHTPEIKTLIKFVIACFKKELPNNGRALPCLIPSLDCIYILLKADFFF